MSKKYPSKPTLAQLKRWNIKARRVFSGKSFDGEKQWDKAVGLARDICAVLGKKTVGN